MRLFKFFIGFLLFLAIPVIFVYLDRTAHLNEISIATGGKGGGYYASALKYKKILEKEGINLKIVTTGGSIDAQQRLINGEVDYAFVQGGTEIKDRGIKALANIAYEPVWVFYNDKNITSLHDLVGKTIAVGGKGSGIYPVAKKLLNEIGIDANNSNFLHLSSEDASFQLQSKTIDAMFYVASPNSKLVKKLLSNSDIFLLHFEDAQTFRQYFLNKNQDYQILILEASGFDLKESIPSTLHTLLSVKTLIATINAPKEMTRLLMKAIDQTHRQAGIFQKENTFPNTSMLEFEQDVASVEYFKEKIHFYEENFDFWTAQSLNKLHNFVMLYLLPVLMLFAFFVEVIVPTINWYSSRKIITWYDKINELDTGIEHLGLEEARAKKDILEQMLHEVRNKDDIPTSHMEEFYTLQNQIANISNDIQKRIDFLLGREAI
jgi:TRAP transporter TAXI family solute receptor